MRRLLVLSTIAVLVLPSAGAAATGLTVDLASVRLDGRRILGRTVAVVTAALGRPDFHAGPQTRYRVGWGSPNDFSIEVLFRASGGAQHAWSIVLERGPIRDAKIGDLLERRSRALQAAIRAKHEDTFRLLRPYACKSH